jgi:hypothetical protein
MLKLCLDDQCRVLIADIARLMNAVTAEYQLISRRNSYDDPARPPLDGGVVPGRSMRAAVVPEQEGALGAPAFIDGCTANVPGQNLSFADLKKDNFN